MERSRGITIYGALIITLGIFNLLSIGGYKQFALMFYGLPSLIIIAIYVFTILYGIACVYCGSAVLKLEDWGRKVIVVFTMISVVIGLLLNRLAMSNLREFVFSEKSQVPPDIAGSVYNFSIILTAIVTLFEISIIFFLTRPSVKAQFK